MEQSKPLVFGPWSDFFYHLFHLKSPYRKFAVQKLEEELDLVSIVNENRVLRNAIRVIFTEN